MVATSGDRLIADEAVAVLRERLLPQVDIVTPNLPEAAVLLGEEPGDDGAALAQRLLSLGARAILVKGGHGTGPESVDHLATQDGVERRLAAQRVETATPTARAAPSRRPSPPCLRGGCPCRTPSLGRKITSRAAIQAPTASPSAMATARCHFHAWWQPT